MAQIVGEAVGKLMGALQNDRSEIAHLNIATAVSSIGKSSVSGLEDIVKFSGDWWLRANAIDALGDIGELESDSILLLVECLSDESAWVRRNAIYALDTVMPEDSEAVPALILSTKQNSQDYSEIITTYQNALKDKDNRVIEYAHHYFKSI